MANPAGQLDVFARLASLVDKSLVRQRGRAEPRFGMLETIREFGLEQLERAGRPRRSGSGTRSTSWHWPDAGPELSGPQQRLWLDRLEVEHDNLRAVLNWALVGELETALRLRHCLFGSGRPVAT